MRSIPAIFTGPDTQGLQQNFAVVSPAEDLGVENNHTHCDWLKHVQQIELMIGDIRYKS